MTDYSVTLAHKFAKCIENIESTIYGLKQSSMNIDGLELSYYQSKILRKDKPTIVMLHGFSADKKVWLRFARHFTNDFNVIIPDLAGHGNTPYFEEDSHTIAAQATRVVQLLDKLDIKQFHLIGNSMGGFITAHTSIFFSDYILSACLVDPAGIIPVNLSQMDKLVIAGKNPFLITSTQEFYKFYAMTMSKPPYIPKIILNSFASEYQSKSHQLGKIFSEFVNENGFLDQHLSKIECPTLILWGADDQLLHVGNATVWHDNIKNSELTIWSGIGHMPMMETPKIAANRYQQFLSDNGFN